MRRSALIYLLASFCALAQWAQADETADARALVEKAIQAHGGAKAVTKLQLMSRTSKGTVFAFGLELPFNDELITALPSKWRLNIAGGVGGPDALMNIILNGNDAWQVNAAGVVAMPKEQVAELQDEGRVLWYGTLVPILEDKAIRLGLVKDDTVGGRPAKGIRVSQPGKTDIQFYFDAQSNLLVKVARKAKQAGLEIDKEYFYSDHQPIEGVMAPTKYSETTSGKKFVEVSSIKYKFPDRPDDKAFEKPQ
jgi:hypothetical protein